jgi:hypothetical protein
MASSGEELGVLGARGSATKIVERSGSRPGGDPVDHHLVHAAAR